MEFAEKISVVMPTYNTAVPILREAVDSILAQTFREFEFIIVDDCSISESREYLQGLSDPRIRLIRNETNLGVTKSLNIGFAAAQGKYIARMDDDDISLPTRFEKQYNYMESHPDVIACGTNVEFFGLHHQFTNNRIADMEMYRISAVFANPGPRHPTMFFNRELFQRYHILYDESLIYAQDYGLYVEITKHGRISLLPDVLLRHRIHVKQISKEHRKLQTACDKLTQRKLLQELLGEISDEELDFHYHYSTGYYEDTAFNAESKAWFEKLMKANDHGVI